MLYKKTLLNYQAAWSKQNLAFSSFTHTIPDQWTTTHSFSFASLIVGAPVLSGRHLDGQYWLIAFTLCFTSMPVSIRCARDWKLSTHFASIFSKIHLHFFYPGLLYIWVLVDPDLIWRVIPNNFVHISNLKSFNQKIE